MEVGKRWKALEKLRRDIGTADGLEMYRRSVEGLALSNGPGREEAVFGLIARLPDRRIFQGLKELWGSCPFGAVDLLTMSNFALLSCK